MGIELYQSVIDKSSFGYACHELVYGSDGRPCDYIFVEVNHAFELFTGLKQEDIIGKTASAVLKEHPRCDFIKIGLYLDVAESGISLDFLHNSEHTNSKYWINAFSIEKDKFVTLMSFASESGIDYKKLFEDMPSGGVIFKAVSTNDEEKEYYLKEINKKALEMEGAKKEKILGKKLTELYTETDKYDALNAFNEVLNTSVPHKTGVQQYESHNTKGFYSYDIFSLSQDLVAAIYNDVTDIVENQNEINKQSEKLRTYIDEAPYGIVVIDKFGKYIDANKEAFSITGYNKEEFVGKSIFGFFPKNEIKSVIKDFIFAKKNNFIDASHKYITKSGEIRMCNIRATKLKDGKFLGFVVDITEKSKLEQKLIDSEQEYRSLFDNAGIIIGYFDVKGTVIWVNKLAAAQVDKDPEDLVGKSFFDLHPIFEAQKYHDRLNAAKENDYAQEYVDLINFKGNEIYIKSIYKRIYDEKGLVKGILIISSDVTDLKESQFALAESEKKYKLIFDQAVFGILNISLDFVILDANRKACEMFGYSLEELIGLNLKSLIHKSDMKGYKSAINAIHEGGHNNLKFDNRYIKKGGSTVYAEVTSSLMDDGEGNKLFIIDTIEDVTDKKKTEKMLNQYKALSDTFIAGTSFVDKNNNIIYVNEYFAAAHGYTANYLIGKHVSILHTPGQMKAALKAIETMRNKSLLEPQEIWHLHKDGREFPMLMSGIAMKNENGEPDNIAVTAIDMSGIKELEEKNLNMKMMLQNQQKLEAIGTLASGVAHEINNPINGIMNYSQLIADGSESGSENELFANEIISETKRITGIVQSLLQFSRQEKTSYSLAYISDIIDATLMLIKTIMKHDMIDFIIEIDNGLPQIRCRSQQIQQVILNLMTNACDSLKEKYERTSDEKKLYLTAKEIIKDGKPYIQVAVKDNGTGISEKAKSQIFDPFFTTKPREKGTGLGLAISYGIIKDHGGEIYFDTKEGEYTVFYIDLPTADPE